MNNQPIIFVPKKRPFTQVKMEPGWTVTCLNCSFKAKHRFRWVAEFIARIHASQNHA